MYDKISGPRFRVIIHDINKPNWLKDVEMVITKKIVPSKVTIIKGGNSRRRSRRNTKKINRRRINKRTKGTRNRNRNKKNRTKKYKKINFH
jgi:hypothetical protein